MKRTWMFAMLLSGIGLLSCEKDNNKQEGRLVDVIVSTSTTDTKTEVSSGGLTRWCKGDEVMVVDVNQVPQKFTYTPETSKATGAFAGKLLGEQGTQTYYSYYGPKNVTYCPENNFCINIERSDLVVEEDGLINPAFFGQYCPMVAVPVKFDAENTTQSKGLQFHHANCLIEASITSLPTDGRLAALLFDKVVFEVRSTSKDAPFNTQIRIDMTKITDSPVSIPYEQGANKVNVMTSSIQYKAPGTIKDRTTELSTYGVPVFALPTTTPFDWVATVYLYNKETLVCTLQKTSKVIANGLTLSGLNVLDFDEADIIK